MENTEEITGYVAPQQPKRWFHNGWFSRGSLLVAGLFFLLPFIDINCSGTKLASISGTDMVFGKELKPEKAKSLKDEADTTSSDAGAALSGEDTLMDDAVPENISGGFNFSQNPFEKNDKKRIDPNALAITAFAALILALLFSFFSKRIWIIVSGGLSLLGVLCLFFIRVQISSEIEKQLGPMNFMPITFEFTSFYWLCILFFAVAAVFSFVRSSYSKS